MFGGLEHAKEGLGLRVRDLPGCVERLCCAGGGVRCLGAGAAGLNLMIRVKGLVLTTSTCCTKVKIIFVDRTVLHGELIP